MGIFYDNTDNTYIVTVGDYRIKTTVTSSCITATYWIDEILRITGQCPKPVIVGLDIEWCPPNWHGTVGENPVALLQLCVGSRCLLFQLQHCEHIPTKLYGFFMDDRFRFVGVDIKKDLDKLENQYGLMAGSCWDDLGCLAEQNMGRPDIKGASLKSLTQLFLGIQMEKPFFIRTSDWGRKVLSPQQIEYAALDAFTSCHVGLQVFRRNL